MKKKKYIYNGRGWLVGLLCCLSWKLSGHLAGIYDQLFHLLQEIPSIKEDFNIPKAERAGYNTAYNKIINTQLGKCNYEYK